MSELREQAFEQVFGGFEDGAGAAAAPAPPKRRRWLIVLTGFASVIVLLVGGGYLAIHQLKASYDKNIERFGDPFKTIPQSSRPTVEAGTGDAMNILLLGSDSRVSAGNASQWTVGAQRTDAIMILHVTQKRDNLQIISIPRDSWVPIPGHGDAKINAGFSYGGPTLMVQTVEAVTGVRIDHMAIVDFDGFKQITDALGGVTITIPKSVKDKRATFKAGTYHMDGATALDYVRQRKALPGGDFDREKRQQNWIRSIMKQLDSTGTLTNPLKVNSVIEALTSALATDDHFTLNEMEDLALSLRNVSPSDVTFLTAPVAGTGRSPDGKQSIVNLDKAADATLWTAIRKDQMTQWIATYKPTALGTTVR